MRLTIICPSGLVADANQLAMVLGEGPGEANTYGEPSWQDVGGNLYTAASLEVTEGFVGAASSALARPAWDITNLVNMAGAGRAQAAIQLWGHTQSDEPNPVPAATPTVLLAMFGGDPVGLIQAAGLTAVPTEEPFP